MAEETIGSCENINEVIGKCSDVFLNGESENLDGTGDDDVSLENGDNSVSDKIMPRKSSLMNKSRARRLPMKKTVSFNSMPTERKIATGQLLIIIFSYSLLVKCMQVEKQIVKLAWTEMNIKICYNTELSSVLIRVQDVSVIVPVGTQSFRP